jgi:prolipoprotein diacylglyceryltransferase
MLPTLSLGPLSLRLPELLLLFGFWIGWEQARRLAPRSGVDPDILSRLIGISLAAGVIGARLTYVFTHLNAFAGQPLSVLALTPEMLDLSGGLLFAGLAGLIAGKRLALRFWPALDALAPGLAVFAVALGLSHLSSGDAFGSPTSLPWGIELWGARRHPTQVYETLLAWIVALIVWPRPNDLASRLFHAAPGSRFWIFTAGTALAALIVTGFRGDSPLLFEAVRQAQVGAWLVLALALWQLRSRLQQGPAQN